MVKKQFLLTIPVKCELAELSKTLLLHGEAIANFFGLSVLEAITNIDVKGLVVVSDGHDLLLFSRESASLEFENGMTFVNPREVVWALYLAVEAVNKGKECVYLRRTLDIRSAASLCVPENFCLVLVGGVLYPAFDWTGMKPSREDKEIVKAWIHGGRQAVEKENYLDENDIDWV